MMETTIEVMDGGRDSRAHSAINVSVGVSMYLVNIILPEPKRTSRAFSAHKSARSFARRSIREGADLVQIVFRPSSAEGEESDALRNVYRADIDAVNHVRRHVRVPVDAWRELVSRLRSQGKVGVTAADTATLPVENIDETAEDSRVKVARTERPARR